MQFSEAAQHYIFTRKRNQLILRKASHARYVLNWSRKLQLNKMCLSEKKICFIIQKAWKESWNFRRPKSILWSLRLSLKLIMGYLSTWQILCSLGTTKEIEYTKHVEIYFLHSFYMNIWSIHMPAALNRICNSVNYGNWKV